MADLSEHFAKIRAANNGAEIRKPIADAFRAFSEQGKDVSYLGGVDDTFFAKQTDMAKLLPFDSVPRSKSTKFVKSGGIFSIIGDLRDLTIADAGGTTDG